MTDHDMHYLKPKYRRPLPSLGDPPRCPAHEFVADHDAVLCQDQRLNIAIRRTRDGAQFQMTKEETLWVLDYVCARIMESYE